jgi:hypothetical protein
MQLSAVSPSHDLELQVHLLDINPGKREPSSSVTWHVAIDIQMSLSLMKWNKAEMEERQMMTWIVDRRGCHGAM